MRFLVCLVVLTLVGACGRIGFQHSGDAGTDEGDADIGAGADADIDAGADADINAGECSGEDDPDGDGFCATDCDHTNPNVSPGQMESLAAGNCTNGLDDNCDGVADSEAPGCQGGQGTAPVARMLVTPGVAVANSLLVASANGSFDLEDEQLSYFWDWESDGSIDAEGINFEFSYAIPGQYQVTLMVEDSTGLRDYRSQLLRVEATPVLEVTTSEDELDTDSSPGVPGGTGFSLREAIAYSRGISGIFEGTSILVPAGTDILLDSRLELAPPPGRYLEIVGDGARLDGSLLSGNSACLLVSVGVNRVSGLDIGNCPGGAIDAQEGEGLVFERLYLHDSNHGIFVNNAAGSEVGPYNEIRRCSDAGLFIDGPSTIVHDNEIYGSVTGIRLGSGATGTLLRSNIISTCNVGVQIASGSNNMQLFFNTFVENLGDGVFAASNASALDIRNNIFSGNLDVGVIATAANVSSLDNNDYFENLGVDCSGCTPGTSSLQADPLYVAPATQDYRLRATSECVNRGGPLTGLDLNGAGPGLFYGPQPDIGAKQTYQAP